jgi:hypothetical protein
MTWTPLPTAELQLRCAISVGRRHDVAAVGASWAGDCDAATAHGLPPNQFRYVDYLYQTKTTASDDPASLWHVGRCYVQPPTEYAQEQGAQQASRWTCGRDGPAEAWQTGAARILHHHHHHEGRLHRCGSSACSTQLPQPGSPPAVSISMCSIP